MSTKVSFFYYYSFHPYNSIRSVCARIVKALRGKKSELSVVTEMTRDRKELKELKGLIEGGLKGNEPSMVLCSCLCLQSILSLVASAWQEYCAGFLEDLFEKENDWLLLDNGMGCKKAVHDTVVASPSFEPR